MLLRVVEGEPGIFPQPVADVLRRLGGLAERILPKRRSKAGDRPAPPPGSPEDDDQPATPPARPEDDDQS